MTHGSLFTGLGGIDSAFENAGFETVWQCERDNNANQVLEKHWPDVRRFRDVNVLRALSEPRYAKRLRTTRPVRPDWISGGFPCQDLSVAGKRAGLAGSRSGLWFVFRRLIGLLRPTGVLIENVPGLLSSHGGRDLGIILRSLGNMGYGWAYRVLDAQWFGVAQRRRRVFIVGCLNDGERAARILFEPDCMPWDSAPSRETRTRIAASLSAGSASGSGVNRPGRRREDDVNLALCLNAKNGKRYDIESETMIAACLNSGGNNGGFRTEPGEHLVATGSEKAGDEGMRMRPLPPSQSGDGTGRPAQAGDVVGTLSAHSKEHGHAMATQQAAEAGHLIAHTLRAEGHDASEDGTGRGVPIVVEQNSQCTTPLMVNVRAQGTPNTAVFQCHGTNVGALGTVKGDNVTNGVPFAIQERAGEQNLSSGPQGKGYQQGVGYTLEARHHQQSVAGPGYGVRRLMPVECLRLQGLPDDWLDGIGLSDSAKYRLIGNSVARPVIGWIGRRIVESTSPAISS